MFGFDNGSRTMMGHTNEQYAGAMAIAHFGLPEVARNLLSACVGTATG